MILFYDGSALLRHPRPETIFLLEPYIPRQGIILLHGKSGVGKSAFAMQVSESIQLGQPFLDLPVAQGVVIYMVLDMPIYAVQDRWTGAKPPFTPHFAIAYEEISFDCLQFFSPFPDSRHALLKKAMQSYQDELKPDLVVVDALREVHAADVRVSAVPKRVYDSFRSIFPQASILFIHHDRKEGEYPTTDLEAASGSQEWASHATVSMRLVEQGGTLWLRHPKSQASEKYDALALQLSDGLYVRARDRSRQDTIRHILNSDKGKPKGAIDQEIAEALKISIRRAHTLRKGVEQSLPITGKEEKK